MVERNGANRCLRRRVVIRLVLLLLCIAGAIAMAVSGSAEEDEARQYNRCGREVTDKRDEIQLQLDRLNFDSEEWSITEEEKRQRKLESLLDENQGIKRRKRYDFASSQLGYGESVMCYLCAGIIGGIGLLLLVSLISFMVNRDAMNVPRERVWWRRPTVVAIVVFAVGVISMGWMAEMALITDQRFLYELCENGLYLDRINALEREYSSRKSMMSRDEHQWSSVRREAVMSRLKAINKELDQLKDLENRSSIRVSDYERWFGYYQPTAVVLFFGVVVPAYLVLLLCSVGECFFYAVIRLMIRLSGLGRAVTHLKMRFGSTGHKPLSGHVSRAARVSTFVRTHKVILMIVLGVSWLTVMIVYAVNKISAACRERDGGARQQEQPQRASCAQGTSDRERTEREREAREEAEREAAERDEAERKAACDRIILEFQLQQQRQQQQFNQMLMQQMMNQQPINFAPMPTFTPTPRASHTRTCTIHNCEYNPAFGGCPMCKAPDFGNGRKVCCPKCGMSHNSQYNCPRCGAW